MIYFVYIFFLIAMLAIERESARFRPFVRVIIPTVYALLIGLRGTSIGKDTETYYEHFYYYGEWGCNFVEPGFDLLNRVMFSMGYNANQFFIANAAITLFFIYLALNRLDKKDYTLAAFCMYLLTIAFLVNGMRQGVACGMFMYAYKFIENRKPVPYFLVMLLATQFHASALMLLPLYFLSNRHLSEKWYIAIFIFSFIGVFTDISSYIPSLELLGRDYGNHIENMRIAEASALGFIVSTTLNILVLLLMFKNQIHKRYPLLFNLIFFSFILKNFGYSIPIIGRVTIYFTWFTYLMYPILLKKQNKPLFNSMYLTKIAVFGIILTLWFNGLFSAANMLIPYKFYWE